MMNRKRLHLNKQTYHEVYLHSAHWQEIQAILYALYPACLVCGSREKRNINHLTYDRLGFEEPQDLIVMCEDCHIRRFHQQHELSEEQLRTITRHLPLPPTWPIFTKWPTCYLT